MKIEIYKCALQYTEYIRVYSILRTSNHYYNIYV